MRSLRMASFMVIAVGLALIVLTAGRADAGKTEAHVISDNNAIVLISCTAAKPEVVVNGTDNTIEVSGACTKLAVNGSTNRITIVTVEKTTVNGNGNTVEIETAAAISVNGNDNTVTWKKASGGKKAPSVSNLGRKNDVKKKD